MFCSSQVPSGYFAMEDGDGQPSRWNTLRALRVLDWYNRAAAC